MKTYHFRVRIMPLTEVLDTQGRAVEETVRRMGYEVKSVRVGKSVDLEIDSVSSSSALTTAQKIAKELLVNPLVESFSLEEVNP